MKKYFILIAALATAMTTVTSCINDEENVDSSIISLSSNIGQAGLTRATATDELQNTQFVSGKSIFVEAYKTGESSTYATGTYTTTDNAGTMSGSLYYPVTRENVDICAFYPSTVTSSSTSFAVGNNQKTAADYQNYDLMYATKLTNKEKGSTHALIFNHALSKIIVILTAGTGLTESDITTNVSAVKINGTKLTGTISITGGAITVSGVTGDAADIDITGSTKTSNIGIIVPQTVANATTFITVTYNSAALTYALTAEKAFEAGKVYTYNLTLNNSGLSLSSTSITSWTSDGDATEGTLDL